MWEGDRDGMKAVFVGGGAHRLLGILRGAMGEPGVLDGGEIVLYDLDLSRSEAMGRMLMKTPEYARAGCRITWDVSLDGALEGADAVGVVLMAGSRRTFALGNAACREHGFLSSDNVSPNGAFLAVKGGELLMGLARKMAERCPQAWLLDFANPVAVFSAMVNHHTAIKCLGVCSGHDNHQWDLARLLGKDEQVTDYDVHVAGINHMAFILRGALRGRDLFELLDEHVAGGWEQPELNAWWTDVTRRNIRKGLRKTIQLYHELGVLVFSSEFDGMRHLFYDEELAEDLAREAAPGTADEAASAEEFNRARREADERFRAYLDQDLDAGFWDTHWEQGQELWCFRREPDHIFTRALTGISGARPTKVAVSYPSCGAVAGIKEQTVVEYSQILDRGTIRPAGQYAIPDSVHGMTSALATHQSLLGDAIATRDPKLLAQALLCYPIRPYSQAQRAMYRDLLAINSEEIPAASRGTVDYL